MAFANMTTTQQFLVTASPVDKNGNPAPVEAGSLVFVSSDTAVATVAPVDGTSANVIAVGTGTYTITASADADLGPDVVTIDGTDSGEVVAAQASTINLAAGPVTEQ
jgi:hypothetical protein